MGTRSTRFWSPLRSAPGCPSPVFDIGSHIVDTPGFLTQGAEWLIAVGVIGAVAAATVGFLELLAIPTATPAFRTALLHMSLNLTVTVA